MKGNGTAPLIAAQPQYILVAQALITDIESGRYAVGDLLPPELSLCTQFGVSRHTMREAIRKLQERGLITRQRGVGTRVKAAKPQPRYVQSATAISDLLQYVKDTRLVTTQAESIIADAAVSERIKCNVGQRWVYVTGFRYAGKDKLPLALTEVYINPAYAGVQKLIGTLKVPVHTLIEQQFGASVVEVSQEIRATEISAADARQLSVKPGSAGLLIIRQYLGDNDQVIEVTVNLHPAARFSYRTALRLQGPEPRMRDSLLPLAATTAVQVLVSMASVTVPVLAPAAAGELGISAGYVGVFVSLIYGGSMVATLCAGGLIARHGAIRVSQFCLVLCAAGLALTATGIVPVLLLAAVLIGFGYGPVTPASSHILSMNTPPHRMSFIFSIKQTGVPIGGAFAGALVPILVLWGGWRAAALVVAAACVATIALAQPCRALFDGQRRPGHRAGMAGLASSLRLTLVTPAIRRLAISSFFFAALQLCLVTYLVTYLTGTLGYTLVQAGLTLSVANGAGIAGRIVWGALAGRGIDSVRVLALLACAMAAAAALTATFSPAWPAAAVMLVAALFGATAIGWNGVYLAEVAKLAPEGRIAEVTGGGLFFTYFGVFVGPAAFAFLVEHGVGYGEAFVLIAIPVLASGIRLMFLPPDPAPHPAPAHVTPAER